MLIKLRLNVPLRLLGDMFGISLGYCSYILHLWIPFLSKKLEPSSDGDHSKNEPLQLAWKSNSRIAWPSSIVDQLLKKSGRICKKSRKASKNTGSFTRKSSPLGIIPLAPGNDAGDGELEATADRQTG